MRQHNEKRASVASEADGADGKSKKDDDESYEVTLDEDFLTALEYGMPPASGMVWPSLLFYNFLYIYFYKPIMMEGNGFVPGTRNRQTGDAVDKLCKYPRCYCFSRPQDSAVDSIQRLGGLAMAISPTFWASGINTMIEWALTHFNCGQTRSRQNQTLFKLCWVQGWLRGSHASSSSPIF